MQEPLKETEFVPLSDDPELTDDHFEDRVYPTMPLSFRAWARENREMIRIALESPLGRSRKETPVKTKAAPCSGSKAGSSARVKTKGETSHA